MICTENRETKFIIKPKDLHVVRLGKITGVYIIYISKINRSFICKPNLPRFFSLKNVACNISYILELEANNKFDEAKLVSERLDELFLIM